VRIVKIVIVIDSEDSRLLMSALSFVCQHMTH